MAATCIPVLNYIAFIILYITCFLAVSTENSKLIGYSLLFVIHTGFILFVINNLYNLFITNKIISFGWLTAMVLSTVFLTMLTHFVSLILILLTLTYLKKKYDTNNGTSLQLDGENANLLSSFNNSMYAVFIACLVLLSMFFYDMSGFPFRMLNEEYLRTFLIKPTVVVLFPLIAFIGSIGLIFMSYLQYYNAKTISKLFSRDTSAPPTGSFSVNNIFENSYADLRIPNTTKSPNR